MNKLHGCGGQKIFRSCGLLWLWSWCRPKYIQLSETIWNVVVLLLCLFFLGQALDISVVTHTQTCSLIKPSQIAVHPREQNLPSCKFRTLLPPQTQPRSPCDPAQFHPVCFNSTFAVSVHSVDTVQRLLVDIRRVRIDHENQAQALTSFFLRFCWIPKSSLPRVLQYEG